MTIGRPTDYRPEMCQRVIEIGGEGYSKAEMAADLGVTRSTMDIWAKTHDEFSDAVSLAQELSLAWWEKQSRLNLAVKEFQSSLWGKAMSGRFPKEPYRDRVEASGADGGPLQVFINKPA